MTQKSASSPAEADVAPVASDKIAAPRPKSSFGAPGSRAGFPSKSIRPQPGAQQVKAESGKTLSKVPGSRHGFKAGEFIVYPAHGVGEIVAVEEEEVAGHLSLEEEDGVAVAFTSSDEKRHSLSSSSRRGMDWMPVLVE